MVTRQLTPITKKEVQDILRQLARSEDIFMRAQDEKGVTISQSIRRIIPVIEKADMAWLQLATALENKSYTQSVYYLSETKVSVCGYNRLTPHSTYAYSCPLPLALYT